MEPEAPDGTSDRISRYGSPDGLLTFLVIRHKDGDVSLGFDGFPSHTHGDIIARLPGLPEEQAIAQYLDALLKSRSVIAIVTNSAGEISDVWVYNYPAETRDGGFLRQGEAITFRHWDGTPFLP
jgi:hypothetical protein